MKFSIKDFFSKCDQIQIRRKLQIWQHLLKKSLMENFIFCAVIDISLGRRKCKCKYSGIFIDNFENIFCSYTVPVESHHSPRNRHIHGYLCRHSPDEDLLLPSVWMKCGSIDFFSLPYFLITGARRF